MVPAARQTKRNRSSRARTAKKKLGRLFWGSSKGALLGIPLRKKPQFRRHHPRRGHSFDHSLDILLRWGAESFRYGAAWLRSQMANEALQEAGRCLVSDGFATVQSMGTASDGFFGADVVRWGACPSAARENLRRPSRPPLNPPQNYTFREKKNEPPISEL